MALETIGAELKDLLSQLEEEAADVVDTHLAWLLEQGRANRGGWEDRSKLTISWKRTGDSIVIYWHQVKWYGTAANKTRRSVLAWIKKPKESCGYTIPKLLAYAQPWEVDMVTDTERKATNLRRKLRAYQRMALAYRTSVQDFNIANEDES